MTKANESLAQAIAAELEKDSAFFDKMAYWQAAVDHIAAKYPNLSQAEQAPLIGAIMQAKYGS